MADEVAVTEDEIIAYTAQIPSTRLEVEGDWPKGTILNINLSLRVRARTEGDDRKGNATLHHHLAVEEAAIQSVLTPAQRRAQFEAEVAKQTPQPKVIDEEPGHEDQEKKEDWSDVEAQDAAKRDQLQVDSVEQTEGQTENQETDADQFEQVNF